MAKNGISKMTRQLQLYDTVLGIQIGAIYNPTELMDLFGISLRMLQRDLKDLRDCGLINLKYDRLEDKYVIAEDPVFDDTAGTRRKQHLTRLYRIGILIHNLSSIGSEEFERYEQGIKEFNEYVEDVNNNPEDYYPVDMESMRDFYIPDIEFYDLKAEYYALFPNSNERTRQRDFEEMCRAGFEIYYSREYKSFIYLYPSDY